MKSESKSIWGLINQYQKLQFVMRQLLIQWQFCNKSLNKPLQKTIIVYNYIENQPNLLKNGEQVTIKDYN